MVDPVLFLLFLKYMKFTQVFVDLSLSLIFSEVCDFSQIMVDLRLPGFIRHMFIDQFFSNGIVEIVVVLNGPPMVIMQDFRVNYWVVIDIMIFDELLLIWLMID